MNALWTSIIDLILAVPFAAVMLSGMVLTFTGRGIQLRGLGHMLRLLVRPPKRGDSNANDTSDAPIDARRALYTAMSTTIGIGNIVGPLVALRFGGPGALFAYVLSTLFGTASTFVEVSLSVRHRFVRQGGTLCGGPMPYVRLACGEGAARLYASCACLLFLAWITNQSHALATLAVPHGISPGLCGFALAAFVYYMLEGGITRVAELNARMVPFMFIVYTTTCCFILVQRRDALPGALAQIWAGMLTPQAFLGGTLAHGYTQMLRWGLARAISCNEAGVGSATVAHSMAAGVMPQQQGVLAMASVYANGFLCLLTGLMVLCSGALDAPGATYDIRTLSEIFARHFAWLGAWPLVISAFLFAIGTMLGNCYNGSQCFAYVAGHRSPRFYFGAAAVVTLLGALGSLKFVWSLGDYLLLPVVLINVTSVMRLRKTVDYAIPSAQDNVPPGDTSMAAISCSTDDP